LSEKLKIWMSDLVQAICVTGKFLDFVLVAVGSQFQEARVRETVADCLAAEAAQVLCLFHDQRLPKTLKK
jgi:hypothetical protein